MPTLSTFFHLVRLPNLLLLAFTMYVPAVFCGLSLGFNADAYWSLHLLVVGTVFIAAGGYVYNDIQDAEADKVNRPQRAIPSGNITIASAKSLHVACTVIGIIACFGAAYAYELGSIAIPTLLAVLLLLWYGRYGRRYLWFGNLAVAFTCALPTYLIYQWIKYYIVPDKNTLAALFLLLGLSAFLLTWIREIIKDIQDLRGDRQAAYSTLPTKRGVTFARQITLRIIVATLCIQIALGQWMVFHFQIAAAIYLFISSVVPIMYLIARFSQANLTVKDINRLEKLVKAMMGLGVLTVLFWKF